MTPLTIADVAAVTGGRLADVPDAAVPVSGTARLDSRAVTAGDLFVAVPGERTDGHDHAAAAVAAGAVAVLATRPVGVAAVVVEDSVVALGALARAHLERFPDVTVVAVTGSSGKTSTKDLLAQVLELRGPTVAPPGSYNNEIGLPLTVLRVDPGTRHLVVELGARGAGHIGYLTGIAPPHVAVVLNVGTAHMGEYGGDAASARRAIADAKGELVEALRPEGLAVLNADDPLVAAMAGRTRARVVTFGEGDGATVRARDGSLDDAGRPRFRLATPEGTAPVALRLYGEHHVSNALAAACVAREVGMAVADAATALSDAVACSRWRMEVTERPDGVTVVNDAYNANPESMRAALKSLVGMAGGRRTWAVLGEMRELGDAAAGEHDALGRLAVRLDVSRLVAVGAEARAIHLGAQLEGSWGEESVAVPDAEAAVALLRAELAPGDVVLVKASRAAGLERVAAALLDAAPPDGPPRRPRAGAPG